MVVRLLTTNRSEKMLRTQEFKMKGADPVSMERSPSVLWFVVFFQCSLITKPNTAA